MSLVRLGSAAGGQSGKKSIKMREDKAFAKAIERGKTHKENEDGEEVVEDFSLVGSDVVPVVGLKVEYAKT